MISLNSYEACGVSLIACCHCGTLVPDFDAEFVGYTVGPDLTEFPEYLCDQCSDDIDLETLYQVML